MRAKTKRRIFRASVAVVLAVVLAAALWWLVTQALIWVLLLAGLLAIYEFGLPILKRTLHRNRLQQKYPPGQMLDDMLAQVIWVDETAEQLQDSLGPAVAVEHVNRKTKEQQIWKYGHEGGNRYRLCVTLDDDRVVRWTLR